MDIKEKNQQEIEQEMQELNKQFGEFLRTKGIGAKFKLAFENMEQSAKKQHEADVANFEAVKAQSAEDNKEFVEFLHTKGFKAKYKLVIENMKKSARTASCHTAPVVSAESLTREFNDFLKLKGLDTKYTVTVKGEE